MENKNSLKQRKITAGFGAVSLIGGFLFLKQSTTGNAIIQETSKIQPLSAIGLMLIACAVILFAYSLKKR